MADNYNVDVLLVGDADDQHISAVSGRLVAEGRRTSRWNLGGLRSREHVAEPGQLALRDGDCWALVTWQTTVWWHRAGRVDVAGLELEEARLAVEEGGSLLLGALAAAKVRWIDDPYVIERAENRFTQLNAARAIGCTIAETRQTNTVAGTEVLHTDGQVVAKAVSPGTGITPHTDILTDSELERIGGNPTFLQQYVTATADLRIVTVGKHSWVWKRDREAGLVDWRAADPTGRGFRPVKDERLAELATELTATLHLTMGVSDWLDTNDGPVFLEINPQGQWLFLKDAETLVVPAVAELLGRPVPTGGSPNPGRWPKALRRVGWDLWLASKAPANDGIVAPSIARPGWVDRVSNITGAVELAKAANQEARDTAAKAEEKASRLVQLGLALLALALAVGAYQLTFDLKRTPWYRPTLIPVAFAIIFLALATFEAVEIDRVGFYRSAEPADFDGVGSAAAPAVQLEIEEYGRALARWTANRKLSDLMQARAWLARGLLALIVAALTAGISRGASTDHNSTPPTTTSTAPHVRSAPTSPHTGTSPGTTK